MDELRAAVVTLAAQPSAAGADAFVATVEQEQPSAELAAFIGEALERPALQEIIDSRGVSVRWRLIDRLLSLGFPHALHVTPDDLEYHRSQGGSRWSIPAVFTVIAGVFSAIWSGGWLTALAGLLTLKLGYLLALAALLVSLVHAIVACLAAPRARDPRNRETLKKLGWMFFMGPAIAALMQLIEPADGGIMTLIMGAPAMLTALLCAVTATGSGAKASQPVPRPSRPISAASRQQAPASDTSRLRAG